MRQVRIHKILLHSLLLLKFFSLSLLCLGSIESSYADGPGCRVPPKEIVVSVRSVRALYPIENGRLDGSRGTPEQFSSGHAIQIDHRLKDLTSKLQKLQYRTYKLIGSQRETLTFGRKQTLNLVGGDVLALRPISIENTRVGMWLQWQDSAGMQVLDTRMHFDIGESVLAGLESSGEAGTILAIDVAERE